ncbi:transient receptor potential cation channel subfamily A member 1 homolog [Penaeus chinensis]|uniref:transient receptor potential cation channel subfamily A member 1 homolog n=1 Tax=Penaeus chinensis TaxID=139456 RepID=UPI001FB68770|nr:transient receptor potential cation channel subfamily A member 1 homolog [Penaeus chinensis]
MDKKDYSSFPMDLKEDTDFPQLWDAVLERDTTKCQTLLQGNSNLKKKLNIRKNKSSLLHLLTSRITKEEGTDIVKLLLDNGADVRAEDKGKNSPLHLAAKRGLEKFCQTLIEFQEAQGSSPRLNAKNAKGMTPMHMASEMGHSKIVKIFLDKKADPNVVDNDNWLPLHYAVMGNCIHCCTLLFPLYAGDEFLKSSKISPLMLAAQKGFHRCLAVMSGGKVDTNRKFPNENTALHVAAKSNYKFCVMELVGMGSDINAENKSGNTPIMEATKTGSLHAAEFLAETNAKLNTKNKEGKNLLHLATWHGSGECMNFFLNKVTKKEEITKMIDEQDCHGYTPLHYALKKSGEKNALLLLDAGASLKMKSRNSNKTCLHLAVENHKSAAVKRILKSEDFELDAEIRTKETPFLLSAKLDSDDICLQLSYEGPQKNAVNMYGQTALHLCAQYGHPSVMTLLLKLGVNKFVKDENGSEALHTAAARGDVECCRLLMEAGKMTCKVQDNSGRYPLDIAFEQGHRDVFNFLLNTLPYKSYRKLPSGLRIAIRSIAHAALKNRTRWAVEGVINSELWEAGFGASVVSKANRNVPCDNFRTLIIRYPDLARKVMDKCISINSVTENTFYDFRIFEDNFFIEKDIKKSPFDSKWELLPEAEDLYPDKTEWKIEHPINIMSGSESVHLLQHQLTVAWLKHKFVTYLWLPFMLILLVQSFCAFALMGYMWTVRTWEQLAREKNMTVEEICAEQPDFLKDTDTTKAFYSLSVILFLCDMVIEVLCMVRLRVDKYGSIGARCFVLISAALTLALLVPFPHCGLVSLGVRWVYLWQCGILSILVMWSRFGKTVNKLPFASVFTPVTREFVLTFLKAVFYVLSVVSLFAYTFFLLFSEHAAFSSIYQAWVKSVTWMFGDLGYDDTFVEQPVHYPVFSNVLFLVFLLIIGTMIVTLVKSPATDEKEVEHQRLVVFAQMILKFDVSFQCCRKKVVNSGTTNLGFMQKLKKKVFEDCYRFCRRRNVVGKLHGTTYSFVFHLQKRLLQSFLGPWLVETSLNQNNTDGGNRNEEITCKLDEIMGMCNRIVDSIRKHEDEISRLTQRQLED